MAREIPVKGKGALGTNVWNWEPHLYPGEPRKVATRSGKYVHALTAQRPTGLNRRERRAAIARKRKGVV